MTDSLKHDPLNHESVTAPRKPKRHWRIDDIAYEQIDRSLISSCEELFYLLVSASFMETGSDMYTANLAQHYADYPEVAQWLQEHWKGEELQHGKSLELYVRAAWPEFDWQAAFDSFFAEYGPLCTAEALERHRALEMVARCVVEMSTTTYYQMLKGLSPEPVLTDLLGRIRADEIGHYKIFLAYFKKFSVQSPVSRAQVACVLIQRVRELRSSDSDVALRHVWSHRGKLFADRASTFEDISERVYTMVSTRLPTDQAVRMLLKPLTLSHRLERWLERPLSYLARRAIAV